MKFKFLRRSSAPVARDRLQILLEFERRMADSDVLTVLRDEIIAVITKHVTLDEDKIQVKIDRGKETSVLEVEVKVPNSSDTIHTSFI